MSSDELPVFAVFSDGSMSRTYNVEEFEACRFVREETPNFRQQSFMFSVLLVVVWQFCIGQH